MTDAARARKIAEGLKAPELRFVVGFSTGCFGMCRKSYYRPLARNGILERRIIPASSGDHAYVCYRLTPLGLAVAEILKERT